MQDTVDLLQIKIEGAKRELPENTLNAIAAVDWRAAILEMRNKHGYNFEQLGDLELETELLLCGLLSPADYPKELENRMQISKAQANELVNEMNELVFKKIREELIKNTERKKIFARKVTEYSPQPLQTSPYQGRRMVPPDKGEDKGVFERKKGNALPVPEKLELEKAPETHPILAQKLSGSFQAPTVKTDHSLENITKANMPGPAAVKSRIPNVDPYREIPE